MSYADLKPVKFDYVDQYQSPQPAPYYNHHYMSEPDPYQHLYPPIHVAPVHQAPPPQHHFAPQHHHHHHPPAVPTPHHQHLQYVVDSHDSDSQDSTEYIAPSPFKTPTPVPSTPTRKYRTPRRIQRNHSENAENNNGELSEELQNHWMPMTWIERSADDPQIFNFVCLWDDCVQSITNRDDFVDHLFSHVADIDDDVQFGRLSPNDGVQCKVRGCKKHLDAVQELHRHVSMHVFQAQCQQKGSEALIEKDEYVGIESCGFEPSTNVNYEGMVLICQWDDCGKSFNSLTDMFDHVGQHIDDVRDVDRIEQDYHNGDRKVVYRCQWTGCTTVNESKAHLRRHARHHSGEKALACPFCARFFSRRDKLYDHCVRRTILMDDPTIEDPYLCKLCQKRFGTEKALCMHVTRHLVGHTCPLCSLALSSRAEIHRHLMTKHSNRSRDFKCDVCAKMFFTESELNRHAVYHSDVMYSCKQCNEKFKWKKQLLKHMKEHDENYNPAPYTCHLCVRSYTSGYALGRHLTAKHQLRVPYGFTRFTYKKCDDGLMRLQTKKLFKI